VQVPDVAEAAVGQPLVTVGDRRMNEDRKRAVGEVPPRCVGDRGRQPVPLGKSSPQVTPYGVASEIITW